MEKKLKEISSLTEDLSKKISKLQNEKSLPLIELDIILFDIRKLYEKIKNLQTTSAGSAPKVPSPKDPSIETPPVETPPVETPQAETPQAKTPQAETHPNEFPGEEAPKVEESLIEIAPAENLPTDTSDLETSHKPPSDSKRKAPKKSPEPTTLADKYKGEKRYINESLAGKIEKNDISSKIQSKPIQNIGSALGINDRFKLINDLFNGDKESFQNTISVLDASSNFNEAFNYITSSFDWDMEEDSVQLLLELVRRKFIVNHNE